MNINTYLGILFTNNGRLKKGQLELKEHATRAVYALICISRKLDLPVDIPVEMYDSKLVLLVTYACEIWDNDTIRELELLQMRFFKYRHCIWQARGIHWK